MAVSIGLGRVTQNGSMDVDNSGSAPSVAAINRADCNDAFVEYSSRDVYTRRSSVRSFPLYYLLELTDL